MAKTKPRRATRTARPARSRRERPARRDAARPRIERRRDPESLRLRAIEPGLTVNDLDRSLRFYTDTLRFTVEERWTGAGGVLHGVMLKAGACRLGLSQDDWAKGRDRKKGEGMSLWCQTAQDIDALAARIKAAGGRLTQEPQNMSWGGRSLSVDDPDGFHLTFYKEE